MGNSLLIDFYSLLHCAEGFATRPAAETGSRARSAPRRGSHSHHVRGAGEVGPAALEGQGGQASPVLRGRGSLPTKEQSAGFAASN